MSHCRQICNGYCRNLLVVQFFYLAEYKAVKYFVKIDVGTIMLDSNLSTPRSSVIASTKKDIDSVYSDVIVL